MKSDPKFSHIPAEDRAALREELLRGANADRLRVFDALNREADSEDDVPEMPESLRDQLVEQFGERAPKRAAVAPAAPGFIQTVVDFFKAKPIAAYGGLAAAACAVMFIMFQIGGVDDDRPGKIDRIRGGDSKPAATSDVPVYFYPESKAAEVVSLMAKGRKVIVCADELDFDARLDSDWAVAVDLDRRVVVSYEKGNAVREVEIEGGDPRGVLLGIRNALDEMMPE